MKKILYPIFVAVIALVSCNDSFESSFADDPESLPAATYMETEESQSMSLWVDLLKYTDMFNTINLNANYTCFVPDNDAMKEYLASMQLSSVNDLSMNDAKLLVRYHTIKGRGYSAVDFYTGVLPDSTASGDYISTQVLSGGVIRVNAEADVINSTAVTNGYVHKVNGVLMPISKTIWGVLEDSDEYSIMRDAFIRTGLDQMLDSIRISNRRVKYTLFAVPDNVYKSNSTAISNVSDLISVLGAGSDYTDPSNELYKYMAYHLMDQQITFDTFANFDSNDTIRSKNYNTMAENQLFNISEVNKVIYINYQKEDQSGAKFVNADNTYKNGIIHVIDDIMTVKIPKSSRVQWEFTDYSELAALSFYRGTPGDQLLQDKLENVSCYEYEPVPLSRIGWQYLLPNKNDGVRKGAVNQDYLRLYLGNYGWIKMEIPSIIAGKYNVTLKYYSPLATAKVGKLSFYIDGNMIGPQFTTQGYSTTANSYQTLSLGEIEFTESKAHTLLIIAGDDYVSELDCLIFDPVN